MKILANDGLDEKAVQIFEDNGMEVDANHYNKEQLAEVIKDFDILIIRSATKADKDLIDAAAGSSLKFIIRAGVGLDNVDVKYAESNGIKVKNTPNSSSNSVAELVLGHMIALSRFIAASNVTMRDGVWNKKNYTGVELYGKTLGIIGFGRIGSSLAQKADALGMNVIFNDMYVKKHEKYQYCSVEELLKKADYISLHVPSTDKPIIGREEFELMKDGVFIINAARGGAVDEAALLEALDKGKVAGAGLDVFAQEPKPNPALCNHPNVSCTPHIGAATEEAQRRIGEEAVTLVMDFCSCLESKVV